MRRLNGLVVEFFGQLAGNQRRFVPLTFRVIGFTQINEAKFRQLAGAGAIRQMEIMVFFFLTSLVTL